MSDNTKTPAWRVAEILEEIARKAEPLAVMQGFIDNTRKGVGVAFGTSVEPAGETLTAFCIIPVEPVMRGVDGTPEEVLEWIRRGLGQDQSVENRDFPQQPSLTANAG